LTFLFRPFRATGRFLGRIPRALPWAQLLCPFGAALFACGTRMVHAFGTIGYTCTPAASACQRSRSRSILPLPVRVPLSFDDALEGLLAVKPKSTRKATGKNTARRTKDG